MNKNTLIIYAIIVGIAILSSVIRKRKKTGPANQNNQKKSVINYHESITKEYKKPTVTQPKSLEDILQSLLGEQKPQQTFIPKNEGKMVFTDKEPDKYTTIEDAEPLEKLRKKEVEYYNYDTELSYKEEMLDFDKTIDHHVHGAGFDEIKDRVADEEEAVSEWSDIDWRKAIIHAEILRRPEY